MKQRGPCCVCRLHPTWARTRGRAKGKQCHGLGWKKTRLSPPPTPAGASPGTPWSSLLVWQVILEKDRGVLIKTKGGVCYMSSIYRLGKDVHLFIWCLWKTARIITINIWISAWLSCVGSEPALRLFNDIAKFIRFSHVTELFMQISGYRAKAWDLHKHLRPSQRGVMAWLTDAVPPVWVL